MRQGGIFMGRQENIPQNIILENRRALRVSGVKDIDSFSETKVVLETALGELVIRGEELHIIALETETGDFSLSGKVNSLAYSSFPTNAGALRRIFR